MRHEKIKRFTTSAVLISLSTFLSLIKIPLPLGGGITAVSTFPIILLAYYYGMSWGLFSSMIYAFIQMLLGISTISRYILPGRNAQNLSLILVMCIFDYFFAYISLSFGGLFRQKQHMKKALVLGTLTSLLLKYLFHVISGTILCDAWVNTFSQVDDNIFGLLKLYVPGYLFSITYSTIFNGLYMIPEIVITVLFVLSISKTLQKKNYFFTSNLHQQNCKSSW